MFDFTDSFMLEIIKVVVCQKPSMFTQIARVTCIMFDNDRRLLSFNDFL